MNIARNSLSRSMTRANSWFHTAMLVCLVASASYLLSRVGGALALNPPITWPLWPGCAILVGVLLLVPRTIWPILILAAFAAFVLYDLQAGLNIRSIVVLILADTIEVLGAALGISYSFHSTPRLNSLKTLARYSFFAVVVAPVSAASIGALALDGNYWAHWRISYFSEALALLTLTPAILAWAGEGRAWTKKSSGYYLEAAMLMAALASLGISA